MQEEPPRRTPRAGRRWRTAALACAIALPVFVLSLGIDASWLGPLLRHHIDLRSHRQFEFDRMRFGLTSSLEPTITFDGLRIENAPWATVSRPFARVAKAHFVWTWDSLWSDLVTIRRLDLVDADVDMERDAQGRRNWRLTRPADTGPGRVRLIALAARRSHVRLYDAQAGLDLDTRIDDIAQPVDLPEAPGLPLTQHVVFAGRLADGTFNGEADVSEVLTFADSGAEFALRGHAQTPGATLAVQGRAGDIIRLGLLDVTVHAACDKLADLGPMLQRADLPATRAIVADAQLSKRGPDWSLAALTLKIGNATTLRGRVDVHGAPPGERGRIEATLRSDAAALDDLAPLAAPGRATRGARWQDRPIDRAALLADDARVDLDVVRLTGLSGGPLADLHLSATLQSGVLKADPMRFRFHDGTVNASLQLDAAQAPTTIAFDASSQGVNIAPLVQRLAKDGALRGNLSSRLMLQSQGDSVAAWIASAQGSLRAGLAGAAMSGQLESKLALDGRRWLSSALRPDANVTVRCAEATFDVSAGHAVVRKLLVQTDHTRVHGSGSVDLADASFRMLLTPRPATASFLVLDRSIAIDGSAAGTTTKLVATPAGERVVQECEGGGVDVGVR